MGHMTAHAAQVLGTVLELIAEIAIFLDGQRAHLVLRSI
jgi:hypothetical protein